MELKKRERAANFNTAEVKLLVSLVEKFKQIIENKKTDAVTNRNKDSAWKKIESGFNACGISSSIRTWKTLKLKYESMKKLTKKKSSMKLEELSKSEGGPSNAPNFNEIDEKLLSITSNITGPEAPHDTDNITLPSVNQVSVPTVLSEDHAETENLNNIPENKWEKWHPNALKTRVPNALRADTAPKTSVMKLDKITAARLELLQLQIETTLKQHKFMEEEHQMKILHLTNDEARKQELHQMIMQKLNNISSGSQLSDIVNDMK